MEAFDLDNNSNLLFNQVRPTLLNGGIQIAGRYFDEGLTNDINSLSAIINSIFLHMGQSV